MSLFMFDDVLVGLYRNLDSILLLVKRNFCKHVKINNDIIKCIYYIKTDNIINKSIANLFTAVSR